ncbi:asparagine synthase (glutamine-hydrolyzing) [Propionispora hippei]|uniref:asparagine synthase (glutamine-hydrolyzing) n=1 Tax=Propionispora hippei DSM 15287 TaxID=1123003 RepID=A0A1M6K2U1_9FIRM|nr:asparagine synthase (glutamine-hydrolyzing) [Propionispora hippei]SHJ53301.1 asparagine synthase (glutamine-hydrolysing) [Propionispora hippei DSM 15287]
MCGIVGALTFDSGNFQITEAYITSMRDEMIHRGPDGGGTWVSTNRRIGLGHRRLSIIDLSDMANQPMSNEDGSLWVVFNGEIYNHAEIRKELIALGGHTWKTDHSDTEMILHAFEQWGINCLEKFRGMFAIALWDARRQELWLIRDRVGIKPLYYSIHHGRLTFGSEIKALLKDPEQKRLVHEEALYHYLSFLTTPAPQTLFAGIKKLSPGTWLRIRMNGDTYEQKYWDVLDHTQPLSKVPEEDIAEMILNELRTAVTLRKVSDVPVGVFLSGGIDSSTNAALFSEGMSGGVKTFSIGYKGKYESYQNELHYARQMANVVGAEHHELLLDVDDLLDFLPRMVHLQDEPIADPVCVPVYYVSKLARDRGAIVCQVGEGADELFAGYPYWTKVLKLDNMRRKYGNSFLFNTGKLALKTMGKDVGMSFEWLNRSSLHYPLYFGCNQEMSDIQKQRLLSPRMKQKWQSLSSWDVIRPMFNEFKTKAWQDDLVQWMSYSNLRLRLPELLLARVDKMGMGAGLEARVPFLDHKFVELAMSIPSDLKIKNSINKYILKKAVRGIIPDNLIDRRKQGFGVPISEWFYQQLGTEMKIELKKFCSETDYFKISEIERLIERGESGQVWYLFNFVLWWKRFIL